MNDSEFDDYFGRGTKLLHEGKASDAVPHLEKAHSMKPDYVDVTINLSGAYILAGKFKKAVALLETLSEREPDNPMVWTNLGAAYLGNPVLARDQDQLRAIAAFERALEIRPAAPSVAYNIGLIYRDRQETEKAADWFRQAIQDNPNDHHARRILAKMAETE
ncbi:MAG: tetratricopeptide repeat protein [Chloroflexota bacterium]|nr:MAG: tetratricopeptide repeat protein [Chloroflexota bacterium]